MPGCKAYIYVVGVGFEPRPFVQKNRALDNQPQNLTSRPSEARELVRAAKPRLMKSAVAARCMRYIPIPADPETDLCRPRLICDRRIAWKSGFPKIAPGLYNKCQM